MRSWFKSKYKKKNFAQNPWIRKYGLHKHTDIWHFDRFCVAKGVALGFFIACIPLPIQTLLVIVLSIYFSANLPAALIANWINNPITFVPLNYLIYKVGAILLGSSVDQSILTLDLSGKNWGENWDIFYDWLSLLGKPYLLGLPIVAIVLALIGYFGVLASWFIVTFRKK